MSAKASTGCEEVIAGLLTRIEELEELVLTLQDRIAALETETISPDYPEDGPGWVPKPVMSWG